ncbi:hypothetical protein VA603_09605, partial [Stenotrophomonas sp. MH1]
EEATLSVAITVVPKRHAATLPYAFPLVFPVIQAISLRMQRRLEGACHLRIAGTPRILDTTKRCVAAAGAGMLPGNLSLPGVTPAKAHHRWRCGCTWRISSGHRECRGAYACPLVIGYGV